MVVNSKHTPKGGRGIRDFQIQLEKIVSKEFAN